MEFTDVVDDFSAALTAIGLNLGHSSTIESTREIKITQKREYEINIVPHKYHPGRDKLKEMTLKREKEKE